MTVRSWKEEFMSLDPASLTERNDDTMVAEALDGSILKFTGMLPENLEKHGVRLERGRRGNRGVIGTPTDPEEMTLGIHSCHLCAVFIANVRQGTCSACPLGMIGKPCGDQLSIWSAFFGMIAGGDVRGGAKLMVEILTEARKRYRHSVMYGGRS